MVLQVVFTAGIPTENMVVFKLAGAMVGVIKSVLPEKSIEGLKFTSLAPNEG